MAPLSPPDPSQEGYGYLEDLACGYWQSEVFFTALNLDIFSKLAAGIKDIPPFAKQHNLDQDGIKRLFTALKQLGLLEYENGYWFPSHISRTYLDSTSTDCMTDFFLYRQYMQKGWQNLGQKIGSVPKADITPDSPYADRNLYYVRALDLLARQKGQEIGRIMNRCDWRGPILDIGGGAGGVCRALLKTKPDERGVIFDLAEVHQAGRKIYPNPQDWDKITSLTGDFLTYTFAAEQRYGLIIMANFLHAYDGNTAQQLLKKACSLLNEDGYILIHDYFPDRKTTQTSKAALYDLHMLANTYNGVCHSADMITTWLEENNISHIDTLDLETDSSLIIASPNRSLPSAINWPDLALEHGFRSGILLSPKDIITAPWVALKCQFGCEKFGQGLQCPPFSMAEEKTRKLLDSYSQCLLVESTPPGDQFHRQLLALERTAFLQGNHKAFVLGAGPCTVCPTCDTSKPCSHPAQARPAMEACGIDVYGTMQKAGLSLTPLEDKNQYVKYVGLLLIE